MVDKSKVLLLPSLTITICVILQCLRCRSNTTDLPCALAFRCISSKVSKIISLRRIKFPPSTSISSGPAGVKSVLLRSGKAQEMQSFSSDKTMPLGFLCSMRSAVWSLRDMRRVGSHQRRRSHTYLSNWTCTCKLLLIGHDSPGLRLSERGNEMERRLAIQVTVFMFIIVLCYSLHGWTIDLAA